MKIWLKPQILELTAERLLTGIKAAARSRGCDGHHGR